MYYIRKQHRVRCTEEDKFISVAYKGRSMHKVYAVFVRNWITIRRAYPWSFFFSTLLSGLITIALGYFTYHVLATGVLGSSFTSYSGTSDYMSYLILGAGTYLLTLRVLLGVSRSLITERREGTLESLLLTPSYRFTYFVGVTAQWLIVSLGETLIMFIITLPLGLNFGHTYLLTFMLVIPVALIGLLGMATVLGGVMLMSGDTYIVQNTLFIAITLVCGFSFPPDYLPQPLQWIGMALPVTGILRLTRAALLQGSSPAGVSRDLISTMLLGLVYLVIGFQLLAKAERRALEGAY